MKLLLFPVQEMSSLHYSTTTIHIYHCLVLHLPVEEKIISGIFILSWAFPGQDYIGAIKQACSALQLDRMCDHRIDAGHKLRLEASATAHKDNHIGWCPSMTMPPRMAAGIVLGCCLVGSMEKKMPSLPAGSQLPLCLLGSSWQYNSDHWE